MDYGSLVVFIFGLVISCIPYPIFYVYFRFVIPPLIKSMKKYIIMNQLRTYLSGLGFNLFDRETYFDSRVIVDIRGLKFDYGYPLFIHYDIDLLVFILKRGDKVLKIKHDEFDINVIFQLLSDEVVFPDYVPLFTYKNDWRIVIPLLGPIFALIFYSVNMWYNLSALWKSVYVTVI